MVVGWRLTRRVPPAADQPTGILYGRWEEWHEDKVWSFIFCGFPSLNAWVWSARHSPWDVVL